MSIRGPSPAPIRLLVSARDPGAALHMAAICRVVGQDARIALTLVAQNPAAAILRNCGLAVREVPSHCAHRRTDPAATALQRIAREILRDLKPHVLLCGLSSPSEGGIDEALMSCRQVPALLLQDFWGEQNNFFGLAPDIAAVLDAHAAELTRHRHGTPTLVAGSPRHSEYAGFDIAGARNRVRDMFPPASTNGLPTFIGLFGQPLRRFAGYQETLDAWAQALKELPGSIRVIYRPHPRETALDVSLTQAWLAENQVDYVTVKDGTAEHALAACDAACTIFSNCAYDAAYLNYYSPVPLVTPVLMLFNPELRNLLSSTGDCMRLPYVADQLTIPVWHGADLKDVLLKATHEHHRAIVWNAARNRLTNPTESIPKIVEQLLLMANARYKSLVVAG